MAMLERDLSTGRAVWVIEDAGSAPYGKRRYVLKEYRVVAANAGCVALVSTFPARCSIKFVRSADCFASREEAQRKLEENSDG